MRSKRKRIDMFLMAVVLGISSILPHFVVLSVWGFDGYPPPAPPLAEFFCFPEKPCFNKAVLFNASASRSSHNITSYAWSFGDGRTATLAEPVVDHIYSLPGRYRVTLKITDVRSLSSTIYRIIMICYATDLDKDGKVDVLDIYTVAIALQSKAGDQRWDDDADLDKNGVIDIADILSVAWDYGKNSLAFKTDF